MKNKRREAVEFGRRVRAIRERRGLSQEAFADKAQIHRTYMGRVERGECSVTISLIYKIARALRVPPAKLLKYPL